MKIERLIIHNIGKIADMEIKIDKALNLFYGDIMQGKTTILNSIRYCFGGSFPADILRHGTDEGHVILLFDKSSIRREFYRGKDGATKSRPIQYVSGGMLQSKPTEAIKKFLNPFLLNQDYFIQMNELARNRYFLDLFDVDVSDFDEALWDMEQTAKELRIKISAYGEIDVEPVEKVDVEALKQAKTAIVNNHKLQTAKINEENEKKRIHNSEIDETEKLITRDEMSIKSYMEDIKRLEANINKNRKWLEKNRRIALAEKPFQPDTVEIDEKISEAKAQNVKFEQYLANLKRHEEKVGEKKKLSEAEAKIRQLRIDKLKKLAEMTDSCGVPGLKFNENAEATYEGTSLGMLSMSQSMRLSSVLSELYPKGFGLELIDRGESLGRSIFTFIDRAEKEEKTILATIVAEKPAENIPDDVGVFIVKEGALE